MSLPKRVLAIVNELEQVASTCSDSISASKIESVIKELKGIYSVKCLDNQYTILIAEDEPVSQKTLSHYFEDNGFKTICVVNGKEAERIILSGECDAALLDLQMPVQNGFTTLSNVRYHDHCPIIITTAYTDEEYTNTALSLGASAFYIKPLDYELIVNKVTNMIKEREKKGIDVFSEEELDI